MSNWNSWNNASAFNIRVNDGCDCGCGNNGTITISNGNCGCNDNGTITISTGNRSGCNCNGTSWSTNRCGCNNTWSNGTAWTSNRCGCNCGC